jgi:aspartyl-tRNA(Asn)/glutamyl-tRNA(Gln) amidotransferase subunit B
MKYEAVIGLEVHAHMLTATKIFCGCSTTFGSEPNSQTCPVCIGMPGVLPVLNKKALKYAVKTGLATNCTISLSSRFARKNYFYPDLPKGYQISQYELPICEHGHIEIVTDGEIKRIGITRIHMEEDAGKNIHGSASGGDSYSFVDLNRAGVPLMEIVSEPDIRSPQEAAEYMKKLRAILRYLGVCDGNMEQGSLRCDANISVRPAGQKEFGTRAEVKNINSFRFVEKALEYEIKRQIKLIEAGGKVIQETRLWDPNRGVTESMRGKEEAHDYRYFPEPDLVPLVVDQKWIDEIQASLPELPDVKRKRFVSEFSLPENDADLLVGEKQVAEFFEEAVLNGGNPKTMCSWILTGIFGYLNQHGKDLRELPIKPIHLSNLSKLVDTGVVSGNMAKSTLLFEMLNTGALPEVIVKEKGLVQISDSGEIEKTVDDVIAKNPKEAERCKAGDEKLIGFFVGQVMKLTKGKANPQMVNELIKKKLSPQP